MAKPTGPKALTGSAQAKRMLALLLEALGGLRTTQEAAEGMGLALVRYYQLETRALQAMLAALEPRPKGRRPRSEAQCQAEQAQEKEQLARELRRYQSLCRSLQRTVGVPAAARASPKNTKGTKAKTRRIRKASRGERVVATLRRPQEEADTPNTRTSVTQEKGT
jgi:hypothetical protein